MRPTDRDRANAAPIDLALTGDRLTVLVQLANEATAAYDQALSTLRHDARAYEALTTMRSRVAQQADELNAGLLELTRARPLVSLSRSAYVEQLVTVTAGLGAKGTLVALRSLEGTLQRAYAAAVDVAFDAGVMTLLDRQLGEAQRRSARLDALLAEAPFRCEDRHYAKRAPLASRGTRTSD